jgi:hypothetical protein
MSTTNPAKTPEEIVIRHQSIMDHPLRVQPVQDPTDEQRELLGPPAGFERYIGRTPASFDLGQPSEVLLVMAHNPGLLRQFRTMMPFFPLARAILVSEHRHFVAEALRWPYPWTATTTSERPLAKSPLSGVGW